MTGPSQRTLREGGRIGLAAGAAVLAWLVAVDALTQTAGATMSRLGGVVTKLLSVPDAGRASRTIVFAALHLVVWAGVGVAATGLVHGARRAPWILLGAALVLILVLFAMADATEVLALTVLGPGAWVRIPVGTVLGLGLVGWLVSRRHPVREELRHAGDLDEDV